ncbi:pantoate--beta-alanine ligase [Flavobacterium sp.]|uniref:pantoate--beta-alanine ligase n=1 Tax=Flavobacterium sp. TaxID=239 RepID=UPI0038FD286F
MLVFNTNTDLIGYLKSNSTTLTSIGFVPTMGALHQGHLSLMQKSLSENEITVVSIFVNPTQFNNPEDLAKYPRTLEDDIHKITILDPNIIVFAPTIDNIYNGNTKSDLFDFDDLENQMEGKFRPGHFNGVGTIVKRLFEIVNPTVAYFGEKDFQQLQIIKKLVAKYNLKVTIKGCPILREPNNLAMSSRNALLSFQEKQEAAILYKTLITTKVKFEKESALEITKWVQKSFEKNPNFKLDYFQIADEKTLVPCTRKSKAKKYRAFIAVYVNNIRLIDTIPLN